MLLRHFKKLWDSFWKQWSSRLCWLLYQFSTTSTNRPPTLHHTHLLIPSFHSVSPLAVNTCTDPVDLSINQIFQAPTPTLPSITLHTAEKLKARGSEAWSASTPAAHSLPAQWVFLHFQLVTHKNQQCLSCLSSQLVALIVCIGSQLNSVSSFLIAKFEGFTEAHRGESVQYFKRKMQKSRKNKFHLCNRDILFLSCVNECSGLQGLDSNSLSCWCIWCNGLYSAEEWQSTQCITN